MLPPWAATNRRDVGSPRPVPLGLVVKKGSNRWARASGDSPGPSSATSTIPVARPRPRRRRPTTRCPASTAFLIRLTTTPWILCASHARRQLRRGGRRSTVAPRSAIRSASSSRARVTAAVRSAGARSMRGSARRTAASRRCRAAGRSRPPPGAQPRHPGLVGGVLGDELDRHPQAVERVLELVGDRRRRLAHRRESFGLDQRRLRRHQLLGPIVDPLLQQGGRLRAAPGRASGSTSPCARTPRRSAAISSVPAARGRLGGGIRSPRASRIAPAASACSGRAR